LEKSAFLAGFRYRYLPVYPKVLSRYAVPQPGPWSQHLGTENLLCIERTLEIDREFTVFSRFYADPMRLPALASLPLRKLSGENFKHIIWRESHQPIGRLNQLMCTVDVCTAIGALRGMKGQLLVVEAFAGRDGPIYYQELFIPPNPRRLHLASDGKDPGV
jgi:GntR family transcriptional regulator